MTKDYELRQHLVIYYVDIIRDNITDEQLFKFVLKYFEVLYFVHNLKKKKKVSHVTVEG